MKTHLLVFAVLITAIEVTGQSYTSYFTGDSSNVSPIPQPGAVLMGGAGENDEAMKWFLERANGGDVVVIRASGSDGYNDYLFSQLGVDVNSVETIVWNNEAASVNPYVLEQLSNAEAIWMAGGDQWDYVSYWKDNEVEEIINNLLNEIGGPVGGISAGMAVLGGSYFNAENGTVYSDESLENPYNNWLQLGHQDFLEAPFLDHVITDTHYDDPDRRGRHVAFMARMFQDEAIFPLGIACDGYAAVCIDEFGIAHCYGEYPEFDDYVYFIRPNCIEPIGPEQCEIGLPLDWNLEESALKVYRVSATSDGNTHFNLNDWLEGLGGSWRTWFVDSGELVFVEDNTAPDCPVGINQAELPKLKIFPNPTSDLINLDLAKQGLVTIRTLVGKVVKTILVGPQTQISLDNLGPGSYVVEIDGFAPAHIVIIN